MRALASWVSSSSSLVFCLMIVGQIRLYGVRGWVRTGFGTGATREAVRSDLERLERDAMQLAADEASAETDAGKGVSQ